MRKLTVMACAASLMAALLMLISGCGAGDGLYGSRPRDEITDHWVVTEQSDALGGTRVPATVRGSISILYTAAGLPMWSGALTDSKGVTFYRDNGSWSKTGGVYTVSNVAGQSLQFVIDGEQLSSSTRAGGHTVYLWWSRG